VLSPSDPVNTTETKWNKFSRLHPIPGCVTFWVTKWWVQIWDTQTIQGSTPNLLIPALAVLALSPEDREEGTRVTRAPLQDRRLLGSIIRRVESQGWVALLMAWTYHLHTTGHRWFPGALQLTGNSPTSMAAQPNQPRCPGCPPGPSSNFPGVPRVKTKPASTCNSFQRTEGNQHIHPQPAFLQLPNAMHGTLAHILTGSWGHSITPLSSSPEYDAQTQTQNCRCNSDWRKPEWDLT